jgi:hypothetical protein
MPSPPCHINRKAWRTLGLSALVLGIVAHWLVPRVGLAGNDLADFGTGLLNGIAIAAMLVSLYRTRN